jgi:hypothetical protein
MNYVRFLLAASLLTGIKTSAQDCNEAVLLQKAGAWKEGMKGSTYGTSAEHLAIEKKIVTNIHNLVKKNYDPKGIDASYNGAYERLYPEMMASQYYYAIYLMPFQCNGSTVKAAGVTNTSFYIKANNADIPYSHSVVNAFLDDADKDSYGWIEKFPVFSNGSFYTTGVTSGGFGKYVKEEKWLITYENKLPFLYVTRKEYLDRLQYILKKLRDKENSKYYGDLLKEAEKVAKSTKAEDWQKPAVVPRMGDFKGFLQEGERFAVILVKEDPSYYNPKLSKAIPQLWLVNLNSDTTSAVLGQAGRGIARSLDFAALKNMLGKTPGNEAPANKPAVPVKASATTTKKKTTQ